MHYVYCNELISWESSRRVCKIQKRFKPSVKLSHSKSILTLLMMSADWIWDVVSKRQWKVETIFTIIMITRKAA